MLALLHVRWLTLAAASLSLAAAMPAAHAGQVLGVSAQQILLEESRPGTDAGLCNAACIDQRAMPRQIGRHHCDVKTGVPKVIQAGANEQSAEQVTGERFEGRHLLIIQQILMLYK